MNFSRTGLVRVRPIKWSRETVFSNRECQPLGRNEYDQVPKRRAWDSNPQEAFASTIFKL